MSAGTAPRRDRRPPVDRLWHRMVTPLWVRYHNWEGHVRSERWGFHGERTLYICACGAERLQ